MEPTNGITINGVFYPMGDACSFRMGMTSTGTPFIAVGFLSPPEADAFALGKTIQAAVTAE